MASTQIQAITRQLLKHEHIDCWFFSPLSLHPLPISLFFTPCRLIKWWVKLEDNDGSYVRGSWNPSLSHLHTFNRPYVLIMLTGSFVSMNNHNFRTVTLIVVDQLQGLHRQPVECLDIWHRIVLDSTFVMMYFIFGLWLHLNLIPNILHVIVLWISCSALSNGRQLWNRAAGILHLLSPCFD